MVSKVDSSRAYNHYDPVSTQCGHLYHKGCILEWGEFCNVKEHNPADTEFACPLCKRDITLLYPANYFPELVEASSKEESEDDTLHRQAKHFKDLSINYSKSVLMNRFPEDQETIFKFEKPNELIDYLIITCADDEIFCESLKVLDTNGKPRDLLVPLHKKFPEIMGGLIQKEDTCGICLTSLADKNIRPYLGKLVQVHEKIYRPESAPSLSEGEEKEMESAYCLHLKPKPEPLEFQRIRLYEGNNYVAYVSIPDPIDDENVAIDVDAPAGPAVNHEIDRRIYGIFKPSTFLLSTAWLLTGTGATLGFTSVAPNSREKLALLSTMEGVCYISAMVLICLGKRLRDRGL